MLRLGDRMQDLRPAWRTIVYDRLKPSIKRQFATQGGSGSGGWPPITDAWRAEKIRRGLDPKILHATHRLRDSFQGGADHIEELGPHELRFGSRVPYGKFHRKKRPPVQLPKTVRIEIVKDIQRHVVLRDQGVL